ncbi:MAG TPA: hypothetical protein VM867_13800, partial [Xanthobacteraceae bacterium]|nr:hypothetical protein [Xanthobacteraceae bacterium]
MLSWLEAQPTPVIGLLLFCFCYALAAIAYVCATVLGRKQVGEELKTISPVTLTPLGIILGLLIAFLAGRIWENVAHANEHVGREAGALAEIVLLSNALPAQLRTELRAAIKEHIDFIEAKDWPSMATIQSRPEADALKRALTILLAHKTSDQSHETARVKAIESIEQAFDSRENRIRLSKAQISPLQWGVIVVLGGLILLTTAMIHIGRPA